MFRYRIIRAVLVAGVVLGYGSATFQLWHRVHERACQR
jgi:hypothetical protein